MTEREDVLEWEQFSVVVDQDQADLIAAALSEILAGSLVQEMNYGDLFPDELAAYQGPVHIYGYYPSRSGAETRSRIKAALESGGFSCQPEFSPLKNQNWATAWQKNYQPIPLGDRLIVVPSWLENPRPDRLAIQMDPGMAFGSGTHPTTQLSLELLESSILRFRPASLIDVGCGSGILAIAAALLGVQEVLGVDTDPDAVVVSRANAVINQVDGSTAFRQGSVSELLGSGAGAPLVVANIIAPILSSLFQEGLGEIVLPDGRLILSGILEEQALSILDWMERSGFALLEQRQQGEWIGLVGQKRVGGAAPLPHSQV